MIFMISRFRLFNALVACVIVFNASAQQKPVPSQSTKPPASQQRNERVTPVQRTTEPQPGSGSLRGSGDAVGNGGSKGERPKPGKPTGNILTPEKLWDLKRVSGEAVSIDGAYAYYGITTVNMKENKTERDLYRIAVKGGTPEQLTKTPGSESNVQFLADGKMIFTHKGQIFSANADGSNAQQLTKSDAGYDNVKVSPNGKKIMFTRDVKVRT